MRQCGHACLGSRLDCLKGDRHLGGFSSLIGLTGFDRRRQRCVDQIGGGHFICLSELRMQRNDLGTDRNLFRWLRSQQRRMVDVGQCGNQLRRFLRCFLTRQASEHVFQRQDRLTDSFQPFDACRVGRAVTAQQGMFQRNRQMVQRHQANRRRNAAEGMGGPGHFKGGRRLGPDLKHTVAFDQRLQMTARLFAEDVVQGDWRWFNQCFKRFYYLRLRLTDRFDQRLNLGFRQRREINRFVGDNRCLGRELVG